jgi:hypothetical protein
MKFDWHADAIDRATPIDAGYRNTQNVRRFMTRECGETFRFDRSFMAWIKSGTPRNMGELADEWIRRHVPGRSDLAKLAGIAEDAKKDGYRDPEDRYG